MSVTQTATHSLLRLLTGHGHLGEDGTRGEEEVAHHRSAEACPGEAELAGGSDGYTGADRHEREVDWEGADDTREDCTKDGGEHCVRGCGHRSVVAEWQVPDRL